MDEDLIPARVYGLDCSGGQVTVVRARRRGRRVALETLATGLATATDPAWKTLAADLAREQRQGRAILVAAVSAQDSFIRPVEAPFDSVAKARAVFPSLLDVQLPFPLEQCAYQFIRIARKPSGGVSALAAVVQGERLGRIIEEDRALGTDPEMLELEGLALWRCIAGEEAVLNGRPAVMIHLAHDRTVAVAGRGGEPVAVFSARTPWRNGGDEAPDTGKLKVRLQQFLASVRRSEDADQPTVYLAGSGARVHGAALRAALGIAPDKGRMLPAPETSLARSLAEGGLRPDAWSANLRQGNWQHPHLVERRRWASLRSMTWIVMAAVVVLVLAGWARGQAARHQQDMEREVARAALDLTGVAGIPRGQELAMVRELLNAPGPGEQVLDPWLDGGVYPLLARLLTTAQTQALTLETLRLHTAGALIRGAGSGWDDAAPLDALLREQGWTTELERRDTAASDGLIHFTLRATP